MKKGLESAVLAILLCLSLLPTAALAETDTITPIEPKMDENGVYLISNANELYGFAKIVNNLKDKDKWKPNANAVLMADITVNEEVLKPDGTLNTEKKDTFKQWTPIGYYVNSGDNVTYTGVFDGQNHTISGLYYDTDQRCAGLFGYLNNTIKNVTVADSYFSASSYVGGVCGRNKVGTIIGCTNEGTVTITNTYSNVGGVCGYNDGGIIKKCSNSGKVIGSTDATKQSVGGVCGYSVKGSIVGCYNIGTVTGTDSSVGGVCGNPFQSYVTGCHNVGTVTGTGSDVGGVYGCNDGGHIISCYYLDNDAVEDDGQARTAADFKNGTVCDLLNKTLETHNQDFIFYQGKDYPVLTPQIAFIGIEDGKTYCGEVNFTVRCAESVADNNANLTPDEDGQYTLGSGVHTITATDAEDKSETITVTVNAAHTPSVAVRENEVAATCTADGSYDEVVYCSVCNAEISRTQKPIEKIAHTPAAAVEENRVEATCSAAGSYDEVVYCSVCNAEISRTQKTIEKIAHTPAAAVEENRVEATCTAAGSYDEVVYCSVCKAEISRTQKTIDKLPHDFGHNLEYCANGCGTKNPNYVPPYNPPHKPSVKPNPTPSKPETPENPFVDVKKDDYYYDAVIWAVGKGIAKGVTDTTFQPNASCTRAEMVTFLYRAAGSPEPTNKVNPFTDVAEDSYYYKAVLWAVEKGIAKGTSETTFSPNDTCTRGQTVAFLYRYANSPAVSRSNSFADVSETAYYYNATLWAVSGKVTEGTSATTFSPNDLCTRGQIVTFLYRYMGK